MRHHGTPPSPQASANMVPAKSFGQFSKKQNPGDPLRIQNKTRQGESMAYLCIYIYGISCIVFRASIYFMGMSIWFFHMFQAARFVVFKRLEAACTHRPVGGNGLAAGFHTRNPGFGSLLQLGPERRTRRHAAGCHGLEFWGTDGCFWIHVGF